MRSVCSFKDLWSERLTTKNAPSLFCCLARAGRVGPGAPVRPHVFGEGNSWIGTMAPSNLSSVPAPFPPSPGEIFDPCALQIGGKGVGGVQRVLVVHPCPFWKMCGAARGEGNGVRARGGGEVK